MFAVPNDSDGELHVKSVAETRPTVYIDMDGDLRLRVADADGDVQDYIVCSAAMRRASKVWKTMLFGGYEESRPVGREWLVSLPEDKPEPILVILNIIHGNFSLVPAKPSLAEMYEILEVTNKYDMSGVIRPWAANWMESIKETYMQVGACLPELIFIAWELGDDELFDALTRRLVAACRRGEEGNLVGEDGRNLAEVLIHPPHLYENIVAQRTQLIDSMLNIYEARITSLLEGYPCSTPLDCDGMALGTLIKSVFNATGRLPPPRTEEVNESVKEVSDFLIQGFNGMNGGCTQFDHRQLGLQDVAKILEIIEKNEGVVGPESVEAMAIQRRKTGI
ncbi:hypothetical protein OQA88_2683 [Cercophora sp. LCS_1]